MKTKMLLFLLLTLGALACKRDAAETPATTGDATLDELNYAIQQNPKDHALYASRAQYFYERNGMDEAIQDLTTALSIDSTNVDYHHLLADVYMDYFRSRLALKTMERAAALYPERIPTLLKLSEFYLILKQYERSMETIDKVLRIDPQNAEAYFMFGLNFKEQGDINRAINSFQQAVEIDPKLIDAWINLGQLHAAIDGKLAARFFDNAIELDSSNAVAWHAKADYLRDKEDLKGALGLYRNAAIADPQYEEAYYNAGLMYMELDSVAPAYREFDLAIQTNPLYVRAYFFRGYAAELMGNFKQAKDDYEHAVRMAPEYQEAQDGLSRVNAAIKK
jgi:tetratricopeptide (TPR) repeat protein